jgi:hypothetical protein
MAEHQALARDKQRGLNMAAAFPVREEKSQRGLGCGTLPPKFIVAVALTRVGDSLIERPTQHGLWPVATVQAGRIEHYYKVPCILQ